MELAELNKKSLRPVDGDFNGMAITVNANAITGAYCREAAKKIKALEQAAPKRPKGKKPPKMNAVEFFEGRGREIEAECDLYATLIKGAEDTPLLLSWDLTKDGQSVLCSIEELRKLHVEILKDLWGACLSTARPKAPETRTTPTNRTISETSVGTSPIPETPGVDGQITSIS